MVDLAEFSIGKFKKNEHGRCQISQSWLISANILDETLNYDTY